MLTRFRSVFFLVFAWLGAVVPGGAIDAPANPNASPEVHALLQYMDSIHGTKILSGQQEFPDWPWNEADEDEIEYLQRVTGKQPAVRGFDLMFYTHSANGRSSQVVTERAITWAQQGGIVTMCLHWFMDVNSPNGPAFYTPSGNATTHTNFDIRQAIIDGTPENVEFIAELDIVATELKRLRDARVPVIWRPFHEEGGAWFWWSRHGAAPFVTAWRMMFDRFTTMHGLDNLIWEFNPNDTTILTNWYPGDAYVDMISLDVYPNSGHPVFATEYAAYRDFTNGGKLVALSENGRIPDPDQLTAQNAHWVYFCTWDRDFITSDTYNDLAFKQNVFNHARVITRDELPRPQFETHPVSATVAAGQNVTLTAEADGAISYQWYRNGAAINGGTNGSLQLTNAQSGQAGTYTAKATGLFGTSTSNASVIVVGPRNGRLLNLSTRGQVDVGDNVMIAGFYLGGTTPRTLLVRAVGPGLVPFGLSADTILANPQITVHASTGPIMTNDNWGTQLNGLPDVEPAAAAVSAFQLPADSLDSALVGTFNPGGYTVIVNGAQAGTGVALTELYDVSGDNATSRLINISTRGFLGTGNAIMIPGIAVGEAGRRLLVRGVGPSLDGLVPGGVRDPVLRLVDQAGNTVLENDDWGSAATSPAVRDAFTATSAFVLQDGTKDAAVVVDLPPGLFTALVSGKNGTTGIALVEVYEMAP